MEKENAAQRLKRLRLAAGLTQAQLARAARVAQGTIGNLEAGLRSYGDAVIDIAEVLQVHPKYLRDGVAPPSGELK